jgi:hypothetical protein
MGIAMMEPSLPIWMYETMDAPEWQQGIINSLTMTIAMYLYMIDSDRRTVSNRRPLLKSASTDVIISNHDPILGYSQIGVLSKL